MDDNKVAPIKSKLTIGLFGQESEMHSMAKNSNVPYFNMFPHNNKSERVSFELDMPNEQQFPGSQQFVFSEQAPDLLHPPALKANNSSQVSLNNFSWSNLQMLQNFSMKSSNIDQPYFLPQANRAPGAFNMAAQINNVFQAQSKQLASQSITLPLRNVVPDGMRAVCEIDILLLKKYYNSRNKIFNQFNQKNAIKPFDPNTSKSVWIKQVFENHFKPSISKMLCHMIDQMEELRLSKAEEPGNNHYRRQKDLLKFDCTIWVQLEADSTKDKQLQQANATELVAQIELYLEQFLLGYDS